LLVTGSACSSAPPASVPGPPSAKPTPLTRPVTVLQVLSAARGKDVELVLVTPEGVPAAGLPVWRCTGGGPTRGLLGSGVAGGVD
jgi:hypothetical protein